MINYDIADGHREFNRQWELSKDEQPPRPGETDEVYPLDRGGGVRATTPVETTHKPAPLVIGAHANIFYIDHRGVMWHRRYANPIQGAKWYPLTPTKR